MPTVQGDRADNARRLRSVQRERGGAVTETEWDYTVEIRDQPDKSPASDNLGGRVIMTPPIGEDYWLIRVQVGHGQAVIGFPKFFTIGVGFAKEEDWNTNLPCRNPPTKIWEHIRHNKGDERIPDDRCIEAIRLVCEAAHRLMEATR
jgi:hypothetical protein